MSTRVKPPADVAARAFDSGFEKEESRVQSRAAREAQVPRDTPDARAAERTSPGYRPSSRRSAPGFETVTERTHRIETKMAVARLLLARLSPMDARGRLLSSAMLRRDEVLLDAVLGEMQDEVVALSRHSSRLPR
jgi:hypothetical protein